MTTDKNDGLTLVMDTSSQSAAAGLYRGSDAVAESFVNAGLTHSQTLGLMLERLLAVSRAGAKDVARVVVTNGPGSFTGLRIGVAAALGYAAAAGCEILGVSSLEAAAWNAVRAPQGSRVRAVQDARRGQVYTALFRVCGDRLERLCEDHTAPVEDILRETEPVIVLGDGAELCCRPRDILIPEWRHIRAYGVMRCAEAGHTRPAEPIRYLRLPQAERERLERLGAGDGA